MHVFLQVVLRFCWGWTKRYLLTSKTTLKRVCRRHHRTILKISKKKKTFRVGGPQSPFSISSSFPIFFVLLPFFLKKKVYSYKVEVRLSRLFVASFVLEKIDDKRVNCRLYWKQCTKKKQTQKCVEVGALFMFISYLDCFLFLFPSKSYRRSHSWKLI